MCSHLVEVTGLEIKGLSNTAYIEKGKGIFCNSKKKAPWFPTVLHHIMPV